MSWGMRAVVLALVALGAVPGVATAATCPSGAANLAEISVYVPEVVAADGDFTVELEGEAVLADGYSDVVVSVGGVRTPVALEGFGEARVTVRAPARTGRAPVTVTWNQADGADGVNTSDTPVGACSGSVTTEVLVADRIGTVGELSLPRVAGRWQVTMTGPGGERGRMAWGTASDCVIGACDFALGIGRPWAQVLMHLGGRTYRGAGERRQYGVVCPIAGRNVRGPATANVRVTLSVTGQRTVRGQLVATRLSGWAVTWVDRGGGAIAGCRSGRTRIRIAAVRG